MLKLGHLSLKCSLEVFNQWRCKRRPLEKCIDEGETPVCHLQPSVHSVQSMSCVPWAWCVK